MGGLQEVSVLFVIGFDLWAAQRPEPGLRGTAEVAADLRAMVNVYNGVNLAPGELSRAEREAERILLYAGIQLTWTSGLPSTNVNDNTPGLSWNRVSLRRRIWPSAMVGKRPTSSETLGFCLPWENGDAVVLADAIEKRAALETTNSADLLVPTTVHELGHLVLRSAGHLVTGIMRARWTEERLREDGREYLRFTPGEAESIRSEVRGRNMAATVAGMSYLRATRNDPITYQESPRPASWEIYLDHALQLQKEGHYSDAEVAYASAMREAERLGLDDPAVARVCLNLGRLRNLQHDYSAARLAFERSLSIAEKAFGQDYFAAGLILNIAITYQQQRQYGAAEPLYRRALCILERTPGPAHPYTAVAETGMAKLLLVQHRNTEAEALLNKAVAVFESSHEPDDSNLSIALVCLAEAYRTDGRYAKAEPLYRRALAIVEKQPALRTDEISVGLTHFPPMLRKMKRKAEARELDAQIKNILPKPQGRRSTARDPS